jgi:hypothetical protein
MAQIFTVACCMSEDKQPTPQDMSVLQNRLNLVNRYNQAIGPAGPKVSQVQQDFINGLMKPGIVATFVKQCEIMIEARRSMHPRQGKRYVADPPWPYNTVPVKLTK